MPPVDMTKISSIIAEVGAAEIMPRFRMLAAGDIEKKSDNSSVTTADKAAERALIVRLQQALPGSVVVGEESFEADPGILSHFGGQDYVWVIDPIDGTTNFIKGLAQFGTMVALVHRRQTVAAWIHDPASKDTLMAEQGGGVWLGSRKMRLAGQEPGRKTFIIGSRIKKLLTNPEIAPLLGTLPEFEMGSSAAFDYGRLFTGDAVFAGDPAARASYLLYRQSKPWDHVPGLFMLAEARGYAADLRGEPYEMGMGKNGLLLAPDRAAWETLHTALKPAIEVLLRS
jgi:fructose-1,6-bisphosphatase/inositol monophosphatase family enzyme